ncbi:MAG: protein kinase [Burkholderiales bacterium]
MLAPGSRLDRFEILELLGAGGMGEVYRAHDSRLRRDVALKLLPENFLGNAERLTRFERETQVLASLNHPNIAALYEIVAVSASHALVLELVEGETLAEKLERGALPVPEALGIAAQMAIALEAAHERGVMHRDLKPGNVKLRPDGTVKLLDFGLAKVFDPAVIDRAGLAVTVTALEMSGVGGERVLGSPACMSPEQARGQPVDKRTDIWAFGCLLYEMLCGKRAFAGERASEVIAQIFEREPDFGALPPDLPASIRRLLRRCLEKDRRQRLRDIGDARLELLDALGNTAAEPTSTGPLAARSSFSRPTPGRRNLTMAFITVAVAGVLAWFALRPESIAPPRPTLRFTISEANLEASGVAISADGGQLAYTTGRGLTVRALNDLTSRIVAANNISMGQPFFSPDGKWVGFRGWDALKRVPVTGGEAVMLADRIFPVGTWVDDDILFGDTRGLSRVSAAGGEPVQLLATEGVEQIVSVEMLAERNAILFTVIPTRGNVTGMAASMPGARIEALDLRTGKSHVVLRGGGRPRRTPTGHLLYASGGTLYGVAFDSGLLQTRGEPVPLIVTAGVLDFDVSAEGTLVYLAIGGAQNRELVWVDRQGREEPLGAPPRPYIYPRISPDGNRVAIDMFDGATRDIWVWDMPRATLELFTKDPAHNPLVAWSPHGRHLAYGSERSGVSNVFRQAADGSGEPERMVASDALQMPISYTPDGRLLVSVGVAGQQRDIHLMQLDGDRKVEPLIHSPANELTAEVSPDGRWLAYDSDESGQFEVYVRPFPDAYSGSRWQISSGGGRQPLWSRAGSELFYRDFSGALLSVPVATGSVFAPGRPVKVFSGTGYSGAGAQGGGRTYDVAPDGRRFLMLKNTGQGQAPQLVVVLNWFEELRRLAPIR